MNLRKRLGVPIKKENAGEKIIIVDIDNHTVGVVVDTVTEVATLKEQDIERNMDVTATLSESVLGVGKQNGQLTIILDMTKIVSKSKITSPTQDIVA